MRLALLIVALACGASCSSSQDGGGAGNDFGLAPECATDTDCSVAAAKCCDCPTYAAPTSDPTLSACKGVMCPTTSCPANVRAACSSGQCELACIAMACTNTCADGFVLDASGCLTCECAVVATRECTAPTDCARAPADCCGCTRGGTDTAVPAGQVAQHDASLGCPANPACPDGGNSCPLDLAAGCVRGTCDLVGATPAKACGRPDLANCPTGEVCTVNADSAATAQAVGVCVPP